jgi:hypothetical protein
LTYWPFLLFLQLFGSLLLAVPDHEVCDVATRTEKASDKQTGGQTTSMGTGLGPINAVIGKLNFNLR